MPQVRDGQVRLFAPSLDTMPAARQGVSAAMRRADTPHHKRFGDLRLARKHGLAGWSVMMLAIYGPAFANDASLLPPTIQGAIDDAGAYCDGQTTREKGFIIKKDVNGDGKMDYILDFSHFRCGKNGHAGMPEWCGSAGCMYQIFSSTRHGYRRTEIANAKGLRFKKSGGHSFVIVEGRAYDGSDDLTMRWNGRTFSDVPRPSPLPAMH